MKKLLLFYIILAFAHTFSAAAAEKGSLDREAVYGPHFLKVFHEAHSESLKNVSFLRFAFFNKDSNLESSSEFRFKRKATELEFAELHVPYQNNFYFIKQYSSSNFSGLANFYSINLHAYLHLYQLF